MRKLSTQLTAGIVAMLAFASLASAEEGENYEQFIQAPATFSTIRSYAMVALGLPFEREMIQPQIESVWWASNPDLQLDDVSRELAMSEMADQLNTVERVVTDHQIDRLEVAGFTHVGTKRNIDLYYAADTVRGPVIIRVSISFRDEGRPLLHDIEVFEGFDESRDAAAQIQFTPGDRVASFTYNPENNANPERPLN